VGKVFSVTCGEGKGESEERRLAPRSLSGRCSHLVVRSSLFGHSAQGLRVFHRVHGGRCATRIYPPLRASDKDCKRVCMC